MSKHKLTQADFEAIQAKYKDYQVFNNERRNNDRVFFDPDFNFPVAVCEEYEYIEVLNTTNFDEFFEWGKTL